ncbi:MAG: biotin--[acetyl-CoA-carboxylase] ligase [Nitrospinota bacterium]|nr:biotin--[acetyl-CoA-carboxylase] ligase [Nitrospinota bacterium]
MTVGNTISSLEIEKHLSDNSRGLQLIVVDETDSTNDMAKVLSKEGKKRFAVIAKRQTRGKGRGEHIWASPDGGIYLSLTIENDLPKRRIPLLNLTLAVAAAETILQTTGATVSLKWPNDIYLHGRKLGGILIESSTGPTDYIVAGIGINLNSEMESFPPELREGVSSIYGETGLFYDPNLFIANLISSILKWTDITIAESDRVIDEWSRLSVTLGSRVAFVVGGRTIRGLAVGVDSDGFLMVEDDDTHLTEKIVSPNILGEVCC